MFRNAKRRTLVGATLTAAFASFVLAVGHAQQPAVAVDADDIGGVVTSSSGPEAGVWVIAETRDLPVRYIKSVVTDDRGRFLVPDLPKANYSVWVRGYGLVDGPKVTSEPGKVINLAATLAPNEAAAAEYYPAIYWYSMLHIPTANEFGPTGKIPAAMTQSAWINQMKNKGASAATSWDRNPRARFRLRSLR